MRGIPGGTFCEGYTWGDMLVRGIPGGGMLLRGIPGGTC